MENEDTGLLNATAQNMKKSKFAQLMRFINTLYLTNNNNMSENLKKVSLCIIEKNLVKTSNFRDFYNFDFESRIFTAELYFSSKSEDTTKKNLLKNSLFDNKYVFKTIKYAKTNQDKNDFVKAIEEIISSQFNKLPLESMLELLTSDNSYMERFISIFSNNDPNYTNNIFETLIQPQTLNKHENQINEMLKNKNFVAKLTNYINNKISNYDFFELCKSENENIKNLISKKRFMEWLKFNPGQLNIMVNHFNIYVNDLPNEILLKDFENEQYAVVRAVSDTKFEEILALSQSDIKNDINKIRQVVNVNDEQAKDEQKDNNNANDNTVLSSDDDINTNTNAPNVENVNDKQAKNEQKDNNNANTVLSSDDDINTNINAPNVESVNDKQAKNEQKDNNNANTVLSSDDDINTNTNAPNMESVNNEKTSHKTRNVSLITAGVFVASTFITLTILALIGTLTFGTGYIILFGALSAAGTGMTAWGSKSLDKEKIEELTIKDPIYYTKIEIAFYGCRKPIKERIRIFDSTRSSILSRTKPFSREPGKNQPIK